MALEVFANLAQTAVSSGGTSAPPAGTVETWTVASPGLFPQAVSGATKFHVGDTNPLYNGEIIRVAAVSGGSWTVVRGSQGTTPVSHLAGFTVTLVVTRDALQSFQYQPWQFRVENYGAKGDGAFLYDAAMTSGSAVLTTSGLPAPSAPALGQSAGGTVANGTYLVQVTYVNQFGETLASAAASITTAGGNGTITVTSPLPWTNATGYYVYCTQAGGGAGTETRQQAPGSPTPLRTSYVISAPPSNTGAAPPVSNTSASAPFTSADPGKSIIVPSAGGASTTPLVTTILSFQSATQVTLSAAASATVTGNGAVYGSDDTGAVQSAINAAVAFAQTAGKEQGVGEVLFDNRIYCIAGPLQGTYQNAQLTLPYVDSYAGPKVTLKLTGPVPASGGPHWEQPNPLGSGAVLASIFFNSTSSPVGTGSRPAPYPAVIAGPVTGFGGGGGLFSNMRAVVDGINVLAAYRPCINGLDLYGCGQADIKSFSYTGMAVVTGTAAGGWPLYPANKTNPSPWHCFGYRTPGLGNNAVNTCDRLTVFGSYHGVIYTDHFAAVYIESLYTFYGATLATQGSVGQGHNCSILSLCAEGNQSALFCDGTDEYGNKAGAVFVGALHSELVNFAITDPSNLMYGEVRGETGSGAAPGSFAALSGAANIRFIDSFQPPGNVSSPPAVPATGVALTNQFWRDATVIVTGGTVTVIAIDGQATGLTAGPVTVRTGGTITLTYSVAPTWAWVLD